MSVTMICPNLACGQTVVAADSARGKVVRCAHCHCLFMVPRDAKPVESDQPPEAGKPGKKRH